MPDTARDHELARFDLATGDVVLRRARRADVPAIVALLVDDPLGRGREGADVAEGLEPYLTAFDAIEADPAHLLVVAESSGEVIGTMQLTVIPGLSRRGTTRAQVEAVRVRADHRGHGLGARMIEWAVDEARHRGCGLVQLTSDKTRADAHRFYVRLGFEASHEGYKLPL